MTTTIDATLMGTTAAPTTRYREVDSPLGGILITGRGDAVTGVSFQNHSRARETGPTWIKDDGHLERACQQLAEYLEGGRTTFDVPLRLDGSPFQLAVWRALLGVPYGETTSYGVIAHRIGHPRAARAVGAANGRNPISIIVPCHRVIGADSSLTGYGWGIDRKAWLLDHEQRWRHTDVGPSKVSGLTSA
jgi:methylated-DNA-[protein]-cysteine S-methyltransferase